MAFFTPDDSHIIRECKRLLFKLPEEIRWMIYELCMSTDLADTYRDTPPSSPPTYAIRFHMRHVCEGEIAALDDDRVYHKGHRSCAWDHQDGKGTSYSVVMLDDDPDDLPPQVEEWVSQRGALYGPCGC